MKLTLQDDILTITIEEDTTTDCILESLHQSRKNRYLLYQHPAIMLHSNPIKQNQVVKKGDCLLINIKSNEKIELTEDQQAIDICYEDALFLIVNKPPCLLVHSDGVNTEHTLSNRVAYYYKTTKQNCPVRPIHRLDKDTSGLVLFCKLPFLQPMLDAMLEKKQIHREYEAFVEGTITKIKQTINLGIARDRHNAQKMRISKTGKSAITDIQVIATKRNTTWVHCILHTGRTHQIRVHLSAIHHPILADPLYGHNHQDYQRLALHASSLSFYHPLLQKTIHVTCPLPDDMRVVFKAT